MPTPEAAIQVASQEPEWEGRGWFPPGPQLAACLPGHDRLTDLTDTELIEVMAAARRQTAWRIFWNIWRSNKIAHSERLPIMIII